ncbi:MAG: hypothetical protein O3A87_02130 [Verrucomicrobia bacterium]|nr:hypothetical protein [Verrucomicrobiota bacterium]MDA1005269.1 hypothetical protein [Verrucomicrobiota bacterium]
MKTILIPFLLLVLGLLASCDSGQKKAAQSAEEPTTPSDPTADPAPPTAAPETPAAGETQGIGAKLLGNTVRLEGEVFKPANLQFTPEAFFVYYSASW